MKHIEDSLADIRVFPRLVWPDGPRWERSFPGGVGSSAFGSPGFQSAMQHELTERERGWTQQFLVAESAQGPLSLPVFVCRSRLGRSHIWAHPLQHGLSPIERADIDSDTVDAIIGAVRSLYAAAFSWWLPPWSSARPRSVGPLDGMLSYSSIQTHVIEREDSWEQVLTSRVSKRQLQYARTSSKRGLQLVDKPSAELVDAYVDLYERVSAERNWAGMHFSRQFFHAAASSLGEGGQLVVALYEGRVVGGGVLLFDQRAVHYFQGTVERAAQSVRPHSLLYLHAIQQAEARGLRYVNLGGVAEDNAGLANYKQLWGAQPRPITLVRWQCRPLQAVQWVARSLLEARGLGMTGSRS